MYRQSGGILREGDQGRAHELRHRDLYLLPWLNVQALAQDSSLLPALMHQRTSFNPSEFADFDQEQIDWAFRLDQVAMKYNPHCVAMQGQRFGKLADWDADAFHRFEMTSFPRALLTLEAQYTLSTFLVQSIALMMDQSSGPWQETGRSKICDLANSSVLSPNKLIVQSTFAGTPYSAPPSFDIKGMVEVLRGRVRAAEDELWYVIEKWDAL